MNFKTAVYLNERYGNTVKPEQAWTYAAYLYDRGYTTYEAPYGFFTAKPVGDAVLVHDIYGNIPSLKEDIRTLAHSQQKTVIIDIKTATIEGTL